MSELTLRIIIFGVALIITSCTNPTDADNEPPPITAIPLTECESALWDILLTNMEAGGFNTATIEAPVVQWVDGIDETTLWCDSPYAVDSCSRNGWIVVRRDHPSAQYVLFHELTHYALKQIEITIPREDERWATLFDPILNSDLFRNCAIPKAS